MSSTNDSVASALLLLRASADGSRFPVRFRRGAEALLYLRSKKRGTPALTCYFIVISSRGAVILRPDTSHIQSYQGNVRDYNGTGVWSISGVQARYRQYCDLLQISYRRQPEAKTHREGDEIWIYPIMEDVIRGIEDGDAACIALGVDFVEEDSLFAFGKTLKANTARSLRRALLSEAQKGRLRERIVTMLISGIIPHEMREYAKLLRVIGVGTHWQRLERDIPRGNLFAMRFYKVLRMAEGSPVEK